MAETWLNKAFDSLTEYEGFSPTPYWDVNAWRIGFGSDTVTLPDGTVQKVTKNTPAITRTDAGRDLARSMPIYAKTVVGQMGQDKWDGLSDSMKAQLVSNGYNYGSLPAPLLDVIKKGGDDVDIAVAIDKLGYRKGINNPERRKTEAVRSLEDTDMAAKRTTVAQADDDPFGSAFGKFLKPGATDAPAVAKPSDVPKAPPAADDDPFSLRFGKHLDAAATGPAPHDTAPTQKPVIDATLDEQPGANVARGPTIPKDVNKLLATMNRPSVPYERGDSSGPQRNIVEPDSYAGKLDSGVARGFQDVGDTASVYGLKAAAAGAGALADHGILNKDVAKSVQNTSDAWDTTTAAGRKGWEAAHPGTPPLWGIIPTDPASIGRVGGQVLGAAPFAAVGGGIAGGAAKLVTSNPLLRSIITAAGGNIGQVAGTLRASDQPVQDQLVTGAVLGGLFGGGGHVVTKVGGSIFDKLFGKDYKGPALDTFSKWLEEIGITPKDAEAELAKLGPDATYADLDKALQAKAVTISSLGDKPTQTVKEAFGERAATGPARTAQQVNDILGPAPDANAVKEAISTAASTKAEPFYTAAKAKGTVVDAQPALDWLDNEISNSKGGTKDALTGFRKLLFSDRDVPKLDAAGKPVLDASGNKVMEKQSVLDSDLKSLHQARIEMDQDINALKKTPEGSARNTQLAKMQAARAKVDELLKSDPDFKAADEAFSEYKKIGDSFTQGQTVFDNKLRADDLRRLVVKATPEQLQMLQFGARGAIDDVLGKGTRGELAAAETLFGKKSFNREKLAILFPDKADDVLDMVRANAVMRDTENKVNARSPTGDITRGQEEFTPKKADMAEWAGSIGAGWLGGQHFGADIGLLAGGAFKGVTNALRTLEARGLKLTNEQLARIISAGEGERSTITNALLKRQNHAIGMGAVKKVIGLGARVGAGTARLPSP